MLTATVKRIIYGLIAITIVVTAVFMTNLDLWIVNVALVDMGRDFGGSLSGLSWVLNAYAVTLAALLVPADLLDGVHGPSIATHDWGLTGHFGGRVLQLPRGRVVGGSSAVNATFALRGSPFDYDAWRQPGWSFAEVMPSFVHLESVVTSRRPCITVPSGRCRSAGISAPSSRPFPRRPSKAYGRRASRGSPITTLRTRWVWPPCR